MPTVHGLTDRYLGHLLPVLSGPGACVGCGTAVAGAARCGPCRRAPLLLAHPAAAVTSVALAVKGGRLAGRLASYKRPGQTHARADVGALLWRWLSRHEACLAGAAGVSGFGIVTTVPGLRERAEDPLAQVVGRLVLPVRDRYRRLLSAGPGRELPFSDTRFACPRLRGDPAVLLVDDTWTTGGHAQSAASALRLAGAGPVAVLTVGRHFHPGPPAPYDQLARAYLDRARAQGWSWERCALCAQRHTRRIAG